MNISAPPAKAFLAVLVTGGRKYNDAKARAIIFQALDKIHSVKPINLIIHGACKDPKTGKQCGADLVAQDWALANEVDYQGWPAKWARFGNSAGPRRNAVMAVALASTPGAKVCVAFPGGAGTEDMVDRAMNLQARGIAVDLLRIEPDGTESNVVPFDES
jgi:hypothetical protein